MKAELTQQQIDSYREQGFLAIEGFYDSDEIALWDKVVEEAVNRRLEALDQLRHTRDLKQTLLSWLRLPMRALLGRNGIHTLRQAARAVLGSRLVPQGFYGILNTNQGDRESYYARVYIQCMRLVAENEALRRLVVDPRLGRVAGTLAGVDGVRLYHDQALYKPQYAHPTAWHLDNPYWSFFSRHAMTMWVAIGDASLANGCMWYLPGSHRTATLKNVPIGDDFAGLFKLYPEWMRIEPIPVPCRAGSVVFHNGLIAHAAGVNMTNRPRRAFAVAFMPDGSRFNGIKDVLDDGYFKSLQTGDLLNDERFHPLIWHRNREARQPSMTPVNTADIAPARA